MSDHAPPHQTISRPGRDAAEHAAQTLCFAAGGIVFEVGDPGHALYLIRSGEVEITRQGAEGQRRIGRLGPGEFFGEHGVLIGGPRRSRATAAVETELLELDALLFEEMCRDRPDLALRFTRSLAIRADTLEQRLVTPAGPDAVRAMVGILLARARAVGEVIQVDGALRALAGESGLSLSEAHRTLQVLFERKVISLVDDVIQVPRLETLAAAGNPSPATA